jgi:hypothetical protein
METEVTAWMNTVAGMSTLIRRVAHEMDYKVITSATSCCRAGSRKPTQPILCVHLSSSVVYALAHGTISVCTYSI